MDTKETTQERRDRLLQLKAGATAAFDKMITTMERLRTELPDAIAEGVANALANDPDFLNLMETHLTPREVTCTFRDWHIDKILKRAHIEHVAADVPMSQAQESNFNFIDEKMWVLPLSREKTISEITEDLQEYGLRPATFPELIAFSIQHRDVALKMRLLSVVPVFRRDSLAEDKPLGLGYVLAHDHLHNLALRALWVFPEDDGRSNDIDKQFTILAVEVD